MSARIHTYRGGMIENRHTASIAVVSPSGQLVASAGNPSLMAHLRSSSKPFQAQALFQSGAAAQFGLSQKQIAITCASHMGAAIHTETIAGYLEKLGLSPDYLACGAHEPIDEASAKALQRAHAEPSVLHSNCSGKHSGMLASALAFGANPRGYENPDHIVQQTNFATVRALADVREIPYGIDGCSVPAHILPLQNAARMFAQLADPGAAPAAYRDGLEQTYQAMRAHPEMVSGEGGMDTALMRMLPDFACKGGADGYFGMALRNTRWGPLGVTFKVETGVSDVKDPLVIKLLEVLGALSPDAPTPYRRPPLLNVRRLEIGWIEAELALAWH
jgi:L-asparaginase II